MPRSIVFAQLVVVLSLLATPCIAQTATTTRHALERSTPEAEGVASTGIIEFIKAADEQVNSIHSLMVVRHGKVVADAWWAPEAADKPHVLWSLSKSFTSTAVGLAVAEGKLDIDAKVIDFFPDELPENVSDNLRELRIRHLLTMSVGHDTEMNLRSAKAPWTKSFLQHPIPLEPGSKFLYNTPATYMLSAIVQKVTGQTVRDYLVPRLFDPLGIDTPRWDKSASGISLGGFGLYLKTEDIAKFGQLYLQKGEWRGKQLVPSEWIEQATSKQVSNGSDANNDWNQGYGFQFWRCRHNAYRGDGRAGQYCFILPDQDVVIAITSNTDDMGKEMNLVWEHLLPAFKDKPLPPDSEAQDRLHSIVDSLEATR